MIKVPSEDLSDIIVSETADSFSQKIEEYVWEHDVSYMDAMLELAKKLNYDETVIKSLLTPEILTHIQHDAEKLNIIKSKKSKKLF
jgi:translation initiation factor 2 beta subunit (eIF-2beta)/eIF-5